MGNILRADIEIVGTRPALWHRFGPEALPLTKVEREGVAGNDPSEWLRTVLVTKDGQLFFDSTYIFSALREGAKYTKKGRGSIQNSVSATLQVLDDRVLTDRFMPEGQLTEDPEAPVYLDIRGVRNPSTKARNVRYRVAASVGWKARFSIIWDKTVVSRGEMEAVMNDTGKLVGLSNGRVIGFGRFSVTEFSVTDY